MEGAMVDQAMVVRKRKTRDQITHLPSAPSSGWAPAKNKQKPSLIGLEIAAGPEFDEVFTARYDYSSGERRLMFAVFVEAIVAYRRGKTSKSMKARRLFADAQEWFMSDDISHTFTFINVCDVLNIHHEDMRKKLMGLRSVECGYSIRRLANASLRKIA
jgi:hypothetical protein